MSSRTWIVVGKLDDFGENSVTEIAVGDRSIAIYRVENGEFYATDNICTHQYAKLSEGWLDGYLLECPLHAGCFDIRDGKGCGAPIEEDLATFPVEVRGGDLAVGIPE